MCGSFSLDSPTPVDLACAEHLEENEHRASRFGLAKEQMVGLAVMLSSDQHSWNKKPISVPSRIGFSQTKHIVGSSNFGLLNI